MYVNVPSRKKKISKYFKNAWKCHESLEICNKSDTKLAVLILKNSFQLTRNHLYRLLYIEVNRITFQILQSVAYNV